DRSSRALSADSRTVAEMRMGDAFSVPVKHLPGSTGGRGKWPLRAGVTALREERHRRQQSRSTQAHMRPRKDLPMTDAQRSRVTTGVGALLIALGLLLLAQLLFGVSWRGAWPFYVIAVGLIFFVGVVVGGPAAGPLAIPGALISTVGLILLYQRAFDRFQTWAYAWTLLVVASGLGLLVDAAWRNRPERAQLGRAAI